jgi:hypothetical protein
MHEGNLADKFLKGYQSSSSTNLCDSAMLSMEISANVPCGPIVMHGTNWPSTSAISEPKDQQPHVAAVGVSTIMIRDVDVLLGWFRHSFYSRNTDKPALSKVARSSPDSRTGGRPTPGQADGTHRMGNGCKTSRTLITQRLGETGTCGSESDVSAPLSSAANHQDSRLDTSAHDTYALQPHDHKVGNSNAQSAD